MKRGLSFILYLMIGLTYMVSAQIAVGEWEVYSSTGDPVKVVDTPERVYYVSGKDLFCYDKETEELESYNKNNILNDVNIKNIYYNYDKKYLVIVYVNSNIDILRDNGVIYNISDLKNAIMMDSKTINDVKFYKDRIFLSTDFGIVLLNDEKYEISESYNYEQKINFVTASEKYWYLISGNGLFYIDAKSTKHDLSKWIQLDTKDTYYDIFNLRDEYLIYSKAGTLNYYSINGDAITKNGSLSIGARNIVPYYDKFIARGQYYYISFMDIVDGNLQREDHNYQNKSEHLVEVYSASYETDKSIWSLSKYGLCHFKMENGEVIMLKEPFLPNASNVSKPWNLVIHDNKLYVSNSGPRRGSEEQKEKTWISVLDEQGDWSLFDVGTVPLVNEKHDAQLYSTYNLAFDPNEENTFYVGSWFEGIYKIKDGEVVGHYTHLNSPVTQDWTIAVPQIRFDKKGNLWATPRTGTVVYMLPKEKLSIGSDKIQISDWYRFDYPDITENKYAKLLLAKHNSLKWIVNGNWGGSIFVFDDKGTYNTIADDRTRNFPTFIDQDNKTFNPNYYTCIAEDQDGRIWIGSSSGPIVLTNPSNVFSDNFRCTRIKIPRNDGTDNADYLLQNIEVTDIFVDGANRKWMGTKESGLYIVSADGTEILNHFTTDNCQLPSNQITEVVVDPITGVAYVGTVEGLAAYRSDAVQSSRDYSNVYAFPNPVRPDYEGWISVTGLMENSLVKITDTAGNLFFQGYSNGGQISWDGRDRNGNRVKTGVYLVFASTTDGSKQEGVVTKIMVVN